MLRKQNSYESGEDMSQALGISETAVGRHIQNLQAMGYDITSDSRKGFLLKAAPNVPSAFEVRPLLKTKFMGKSYLYLESVNSTSTYLAAMGPAEAVHGTVVAADHQTAGRGRMQRTWFSPPGTNLYFSILLRPDIVPVQAPQLALVTAAALLKVLKNKFTGLHPEVKWPNDILVQGRKLAGILCEMHAEVDRIHHVIIGIGMNVNSKRDSYPGELRDSAISLRDATGKVSSRQELIAAILTEMEKCYERWLKEGLLPFIEFLEENSAIKDREITVVLQNGEIPGIARGLSGDGSLILETPDGRHSLASGEVHLKKETGRPLKG
jgi:BirA family biotin operon repressor/biotin-[acetyl-CoA-carboxylase] ligase